MLDIPEEAVKGAARELALEEALRNLIHAVCGETGFANAVRQESGRAYPWPALDIAEAEALRALSSPDHADAGKVEGDGWLPIESAPKDETLFLAYCPADEDFPDGRMMIWKGSIFAFQKNPTPNHLQFPATHWRPLPSAPSQEVAGS